MECLARVSGVGKAAWVRELSCYFQRDAQPQAVGNIDQAIQAKLFDLALHQRTDPRLSDLEQTRHLRLCQRLGVDRLGYSDHQFRA